MTDAFEEISHEAAVRLIRRHTNTEVTFVTAPLPGMSFQVTGGLFTQEQQEPFAFAVAASDNVSFTVIPMPHCLYQTPSPDALICVLPGPEPGAEVMLWMLRFANE